MIANEIQNVDYGVRDLIHVLREHWKMIVIVGFTFLLGGIALSLMPRKYEASGSLWIQPGTASLYRTSPANNAPGESGDKIASETQILQSRTLYLRVAKELDLYREPAFVGKSMAAASHPDNLGSRDKMYRLMSKSITVSHNPKDQIVNVSCITKSATLSAKIVNALIADYIEEIFQMHYGATQRTSVWLDKQLGGMRRKVEHDQETLVGLQSKLGIVGADPKNSDNLLAQSLDEYTKAAGEATIDRIVAEAKYRFLGESDPDLIEGGQQVLGARNVPNSGQGTLIQELRSSEAKVAASYAHLMAQYGRNYPEVKQAKAELDAITAQIKTEQSRILNQSKLAFLAASANQKMTTDALEQKRQEASRMKGDMVSYALLQHEYDSDRALYEGLVQRLQEATITSGLASSEVDVVDLAEVPSIALSPGPLLLVVGSLLAGVLVGCSFAFIIEALDEGVDSTEAEKLLGVPLLAVLPHIQRSRRSPSELPDVLSATGSPYAEAIESLRASILLMGHDGLPRVIMITSAEHGAGKSTMARNLAATLAQTGVRTLLIDCDRRRGTLAREFGLENTHGLTAVLEGREETGHAMDAIAGEDNLFVLTSGAYSAQPSLELSSQKMSDLTETLKKQFRCIVLDVPPLLGPADALFVSRLADATIFVSSEKVSTKRSLVQMRNKANTVGLQALGFVHNDVSRFSDTYRTLYVNS